MRKIIFLLLMNTVLFATAQNNLTTTIIESGKTLVDLVRVFKTPKTTLIAPATAASTSVDSCYSKGLAEVCYKNTFGKTIQVSLYKRTGTVYAATPLSMHINNNGKEYLYELPIGIYKFKIEYNEEEDRKIVISEGEIKLNACDKFVKEIKKD